MLRSLFLTLLFVAVAFGQGSFTGTWTDSHHYGGYGGALNLCTVGNIVEGMYSEVGVIQGWQEGDTLTGWYFEAGQSYEDGSPNWGNFSITLSPDWSSFTGVFLPFNESSGFPWVAIRTSSAVPTSAQCFLGVSANPLSTLDGQWSVIGGNMTTDLCVATNLSQFQSSYQYAQQVGDRDYTQGYSSGVCYLDGQLCAGEWFADGDNGIWLSRLASDNVMYSTWWKGPTDDVDWENSADPEEHGIFTSATSGSATECDRNINLFGSGAVLPSLAGFLVAAVVGVYALLF